METSMTSAEPSLRRRDRSLSADAIDELRFATVRRGYDIAAVDDVLDRIAAKIHRMEREVAALRLERHERDRELEASRRRLSELQGDLADARGDADEAQQHTETTRQMFDRDLRSTAARIHELERALDEAATRAEHSEQVAASEKQRADGLAERLEQASVERQREVAAVEAQRAQLESERDDANALVADARRAKEQLEADEQVLGEQLAHLWQLLETLRDGLRTRHQEDEARISGVEEQLARLRAGPLERFIRPD